jgi:hypothetical protein
MIEVTVRHEGELDLAVMRITRVEDRGNGLADYVVEIVVERGQAIGIHNRVIHSFPRQRYNVLGLLKLALETLTEEEMRIEGGFSRPSDLARRLKLAWRTIPR